MTKRITMLVAAVVLLVSVAIAGPAQAQEQPTAAQGATFTFEDVAAQAGLSDGHANILRLYWAFFDREPDAGGAQYWINRHDQCWTTERIATFFSESPEFQQTYGSITDAQFIDVIYANVLDRAPDASGRAFWSEKISSGELSRAQVMMNFAFAPEFVNTHPLPSDGVASTGCDGQRADRPAPPTANYVTFCVGGADSKDQCPHLYVRCISPQPAVTAEPYVGAFVSWDVTATDSRCDGLLTAAQAPDSVDFIFIAEGPTMSGPGDGFIDDQVDPAGIGSDSVYVKSERSGFIVAPTPTNNGQQLTVQIEGLAPVTYDPAGGPADFTNTCTGAEDAQGNCLDRTVTCLNTAGTMTGGTDTQVVGGVTMYEYVIGMADGRCALSVLSDLPGPFLQVDFAIVDGVTYQVGNGDVLLMPLSAADLDGVIVTVGTTYDGPYLAAAPTAQLSVSVSGPLRF